VNDRTKAKVNMRELLLRVENDRELLNELISVFAEEFPLKIRELKEALAKEDLSQVAIASHTLKGMLANVSVEGAASKAANLEQIARTGQGALLNQAFAAFEEEAQGILPELQAFVVEARR
jgi:two-component system, sensor histidine kinase and response regulator